MNTERVARQWLRQLRGARSQQALSRRLGYRTNVVYAWEAGKRWPRACEVFRCMRRLGLDPNEGIGRFFTQRPDWLDSVDVAEPEGVTALVAALVGGAPLTELARRSGHSRFAWTRWVKGRAQPRIHELLAIVDAATNRLLDFLSGFVDPGELDETAEAWRRLEANRRLLVLEPWAHAVLLLLELPAYRRLPTHLPGWVADQLGLTRQQEDQCIDGLVQAGVIELDGAHYRVHGGLTLDTRRTPNAGRLLQRHWTGVAADRIEAGADGRYSFNVFSVSREDLARIEALHLAYFRAVRAIVAESEPECVAAMNVQLFELAGSVGR